jgi:hypothetical protein
METNQEEIKKAREIIEKQKEENAKKFMEELKALCEKYSCELVQGPITIMPR